MTDIVERLRSMEPCQSNDWKIAREAATEIERLRALCPAPVDDGPPAHAEGGSHMSERERALEERLKKALGCLNDLHAMVWGECPSLLNEDSGGSAHLDLQIRDLLEGDG